METAPLFALCQGNVVSCLTAMCAFSCLLSVFHLHSQVIMILTHDLSAICVVYLFASWYVCFADALMSTACTLNLEQSGWTGWMCSKSCQISK